MLKKFHEQIRYYISKLQKFSSHFWYPPLISLLALADNFIVVVPTDGILISSSMLNPHRWLYYAVCIAVGSTLGAAALSYVVDAYGWPWILELFPSINQTRSWELTSEFFEKYGLLVVFAVAATPVIQQPAIILATLANTPILHLAIVVFIGRLIKYLIMAYVGSHAPKLLNKMWGVRGELEEVGVQIK